MIVMLKTVKLLDFALVEIYAENNPRMRQFSLWARFYSWWFCNPMVDDASAPGKLF